MNVDFEYYARDVQAVFMREGFRLTRGMKMPKGEEARSRVMRGSWADFPLVLSCPDYTDLLLAEYPSFSKDGDIFALRLALCAPGLSGEISFTDMLKDDDGVEKADPILSCDRRRIRPWRPEQLVVRVDVPEDAEPKDYECAVKLYARSMFFDEQLIRTLPFTVSVSPARAPENAFYYNFWQHLSNIARKHEVRMYSSEHLTAIEPYAKALGELGNRSITLLCSDIPWAGQGCANDRMTSSDLFEYNHIRVYREKDGAISCDFSFAEAWIALMEKYGAKDIMLTGLFGTWFDDEAGFGNITSDWPDSLRVSYIDKSDGHIGFLREKKEILTYFSLLYGWLTRKNYLSRATVMADEPGTHKPGTDWREVLRLLKETMPDLRMQWDVSPDVLLGDTFGDQRVDIYTPGLDAVAQHMELMPKLQERLKGVLKLWSTCCCPPVLNSFLRSPLPEVRLHGLIADYAGFDGFLRWNFTVWPENPRADIRYLAPGWPAGDTCLVYPGQGGQCLKSLRYYAFKRAAEDFTLAKALRSKGREDVVKEAEGLLLREKDLTKWNFEDYDCGDKLFSIDPKDYEDARALMLAAYEEEDK